MLINRSGFSDFLSAERAPHHPPTGHAKPTSKPRKPPVIRHLGTISVPRHFTDRWHHDQHTWHMTIVTHPTCNALPSPEIKRAVVPPPMTKET